MTPVVFGRAIVKRCARMRIILVNIHQGIKIGLKIILKKVFIVGWR